MFRTLLLLAATGLLVVGGCGRPSLAVGEGDEIMTLQVTGMT